MDAAARDQFLEANGFRFRARRWPGEGPLVLFVHATSFCAEVWEPVWRAARAAGAAGGAVAVDQRGHGGSDAPAEAAAYAWEQLAGDVAAWIDALAAAPVLLVGHSSGGTAVLAAERSAVPAGLVDRLGRLVPHLSVERIDQATHFAPLERPEAVGRALAAFCRELP